MTQCTYTYVRILNPGDPFLLNFLLFRYTLWFRTSCPQPQQFQAAAEECMVGQLTSAFSGLPEGDNLSFVFSSSSPSSATHPLPYMSYEFLLQAENSVGAVNATMLSSVVTTPAEGKLEEAGLTTHMYILSQLSVVRFCGHIGVWYNSLCQCYHLKLL